MSGFPAFVSRSPTLWLVLLTLVTYGRIWQVQDVIWDDNAWLRSIYATETVDQFLKTGFDSLKREPLGVFLYGLFQFHRSTDHFFAIWHVLDITIIALTAVVLRLFFERLFRDRYLAVCSAIAFIAIPLDYTIGYASAINYRIALLLTLVSFLYSAVEPKQTRTRYFLLAASLFSAALSQYVFLEASMALEPARVLMFAVVAGGALWYRWKYLRSAMLKAAPFLLLALPLVIYKLSVSTSGVHAGLYRPDIMHLLDLRQYAISLAHFFFFPWLVLSLHGESFHLGTLTASLLAVATTGIVLHFLPVSSSELYARVKIGDVPSRRQMSTIFIFAFVSIVPVFVLFQLVGRPISWGLDSTHAVLCQIGYSLVIGVLFSQLRDFRPRHTSLRGMPTAMVLFLVGAGVFFSNLNIDQYLASWQSQSRFLSALLERFPSLPEKTYFVTDVDSKDIYSDIRYYDLEFPINLLYARSTGSTGFYRYKILAAEDFQPFALAPVEMIRSGKIMISLASDYGIHTVDTSRLIFLHYRGGKLLVNGEIIAQYPDINYRSWLDRETPAQDGGQTLFPLRSKFVFPARDN